MSAVRSGTSYSVVAKVYKGQPVTVTGQTQAGGMNWYSVSLTVGGNTYTGYMCADYVSVNGAVPGGGGSAGATTATPDDEYVQSLLVAGFPESYCNSLLALHQKYPNWQFVPVQTGLDWNTVVANESVVGRNLIQNSVNDEESLRIVRHITGQRIPGMDSTVQVGFRLRLSTLRTAWIRETF